MALWPLGGRKRQKAGGIHVEVRHGTPAQKDPGRSFRWATEAQGSSGPPSGVSGRAGLDPDLLMTRMLLSEVQAWPVRGSSSGVSDLGERQDRIPGLSSQELPQRHEPHMRAGAGEDSHSGGGNNGVPSAAGEWVAEKGGVFSL